MSDPDTPPSSIRPPIFVGITGKRHLDDGQSASVKERLAATFRQLDADFQHVPKVLLTGAAYGADTIAADLIAPRENKLPGEFPGWSVVVLLPFDRRLFEKDFRAAEGADETAQEEAKERRTRLNDLLAASPRVTILTLPPLRVAEDGPVARSEQLDRDSPHASATLRHQHYEQVGQYIAEAATLLIAVMDRDGAATRDEANGGTERIVACRRAGRPDAHGTKVACRSAVLRHSWDALADPPSSHAWLIEPDRCAPAGGGYPVVVLPRIAEAPAHDAYEKPGVSGHPPPRGRFIGNLPAWFSEHHWRHISLTIPRAFNRVNHALSGNGRCCDRKSPDLSPIVNPANEVATIRSAVSGLQRRAKTAADAAFRLIALLFVLAVICLEIYTKFLPFSPWMLGSYLMLFVAILAVIVVARWRRLQPAAEDYRALSEMLRVQRAWWSAGLDERVDWRHLQSVDIEISRIRVAVGAIISWVWLRSNWNSLTPLSRDWPHVRGTDAKARETNELIKLRRPPPDWIGGQIWYFGRHQGRCRRAVQWHHAVTWSLFAASAWLAALLCVWLVDHESRAWFLEGCAWVPCLIPRSQTPLAGAAFWTALAAGVLWFWGWLSGLSEPEWATRLKSRAVLIFAPVAGLAIALLLAMAIQDGAILLAETPDLAATAIPAKNFTVVVFVTLTAIAGATQYLLEKLNYEAQAMEYHDALRRFERAEQLLAEGADPKSGAPADEERGQKLVRDLGLLALRENEAWLKARRERPLSPLIG